MNYNTKLITSNLSKTLIAAFSLLLLTGMGAAETFTVDADGGDSVEHTSIQAALTAAAENDEDDTITVRSGTYNGQVEITTSGVTLTSAEDSTPTIIYEPESETGAATVDVAATDVEVSGLMIERVAHDGRDESSGHAQAVRVSASDTVVKNNDLVGDLSKAADGSEYHRFDGLMVIDDGEGAVSDIEIEGNEITGFYTGIMVTSAYDGSVSDVSIEDNEVSNNEYGLVAKYHDGDYDGSQPTEITGSENDFTGNSQQSIYLSSGETYQGYQVADFDSSEISLEGPVHVEEGDSLQTAIDVAAEDATVELASGTYDESVTIDTPGVTLEGGYPETEGSSDDRVEEDEAVVDGRIKVVADGVTVTGLTVDGTDERAVAVGEAEGVTVSNNIIEDSKRGIQGDYSGRPTDLTVKNNLISTDYGIASTEDVDTLTVEDNTFQTSEEGIGLGEGANLADDVSEMYNDNTWNLEDGYAVKEYRDDGDVYVAEGGSIQSALDVAGVKNSNGEYVSEESTSVMVDSGSYSGFELERDVDVVGPNADTSGNAEERPSEEATIDGTVNIKNLGSGDEVAVKGFTIESNQGASAVDINKLETDERSVNVSNNIIDGEGSANGVGINSDGTVRIGENLIQNVQNGVFLRDDASDSGADVHVKENKITGATGYNPDGSWTNGAAVKIMEKDDDLVVQPSEVSGNTFESNDIGFWLADHQGDSGEAKKTSSDSIDDGFVSTILSNNNFDQAVTITNDDGKKLTAVYSSVQDAVDTAEEGSTVRVEEGTYEESVKFRKSIELIGEGSEQTVIEGEDNFAVTIEPSGSSTLSQVRVQGFNLTTSSSSAALRLIGEEINDAVISQNTMASTEEGSSGAIYSSSSLENVTFEDNMIWTESGSGINLAIPQIGETSSDVEIVDNWFGAAPTGAVSLSDIEGLEFRGNNLTSENTADFGLALAPVHDAIVESNTFGLGDTTAVLVTDLDGELEENENVTLEKNDLEGPVIVDESLSGTIDAEHNYWGQASGPTDDQVSEKVDYRPWRMNSIGENGYDEVITFSDNESWSAFSVVGEVEEAATASEDAEVLSYNAGWTSPDVNDMTSVDAAFVKDTKAVGVNYVEDPGTVSRSLGEGWNFVGAYNNGATQSIRNVFGTVESSMVSLQVPEHNSDKADERRTDLGGLTGSILSTSNLGSNEVFNKDASVFDGYWLKTSAPASLGTQPSPSESREEG